MNAYNHFKNHAALEGYAKSKGVPMPATAVLFTGVLLLIGGAGIVLGMFIKLALLCLAVVLIGVTFKMHAYWKITDPMQKMGEEINFKKNLALLGAVLMLYAVPFSVWSLTSLF